MAEESEHPLDPRAGTGFVYHLAARLVRLGFRLYGRWKIIGKENVPRTGGVLLAPNHASFLDPPMVGGALFGYRKVWYVAKSELWKNPRFGRLIDRLMAFPVKRGTADRAVLKRILNLLAQGECIVIFPEGERTRDGNLQPPQSGIALLAQRSGVPVVPVAILGTYAMWPAGQKRPKRAPAKIIFGTPRTFGPDASRKEITTFIMDEIARLMTEHGQPTRPPAVEQAQTDSSPGEIHASDSA